MARLVLFNKPWGVLSQFRDESGHPGLSGYIPIPGVYPAGRLDRDSEGLLLLTDDGSLQAKISHPRHKLGKVYLAQVEGQIDAQALTQLRSGVSLKDGPTLPAKARACEPPQLWPRVPPIRQRADTPTSWVELGIREGRNRQIRRMLAHVGYPVLRLVRTRVGDWKLDQLEPGAYRELTIHLPQNPRPAQTKPNTHRHPPRHQRSRHPSRKN